MYAENAVRAATSVAYTSSVQLIFGIASRSINFSNPAAAIVGTDNIKENRAAVSRLSTQNSAAVMVTPEREVPGMTANIARGQSVNSFSMSAGQVLVFEG